MDSAPYLEDFESLKLLLKYEQQNFYELKDECLRKGVLFEDDLFEPNLAAFYLPRELPRQQNSVDSRSPSRTIEWLRPGQIVAEPNEPHFLHVSKSYPVVKGHHRHSEGSSKSPRAGASGAAFTSSASGGGCSATVDFRAQINVVHGRCGCSNFTSALSSLYWKGGDSFRRVVPDEQTFEAGDYAGIFHFRLWQYGKWYDIVVDDRLPTLNGKLFCVHGKDGEFWPSLLEKAFAKLNGCYQSLHGGTVSEYLEDLTGHLCESISADMPATQLTEGLFPLLQHSLNTDAHVVVRIAEERSGGLGRGGGNSAKEEGATPGAGKRGRKGTRSRSLHACNKQQLKCGLIKNQSYVVLGVKLLDHGGPEKAVHLIKLCNPWKRLNQLIFVTKQCDNFDTSSGSSMGGISSGSGSSGGSSGTTVLNDGKWAGSWSEHSQEWITLSDEVKAQYDLTLDSDSHFWMPIESFVELFTNVEIVHCQQTISNSSFGSVKQCKGHWHSCTFNGYWISGISAGGCFNEETFHLNPAYLLPLHSPETKQKQVKEVDDTKSVIEGSGVPKEGMGNAPTPTHTVIIGLMQKFRNSKRTNGLHDLSIGFHLFKLEEEDIRFIEEVLYDDEDQGADMSGGGKSGSKLERRSKVRLKMAPEYFKTRKGEHPIKSFTNVREVTMRLALPEGGSYLVIPSTFGANCDGNFLLRLYSELPFRLREKEVALLMSAAKSSSGSQESLNSRKDSAVRISQNYYAERMFSRPFDKIAIQNENVDVEHLEVLLKSITTLSRNYFSLEQCQTLLALYDLDYKGSLSDGQTKLLAIDLDESYSLFLRYDKTASRSISGSELKAALAEAGIMVSQAIVEILVNRFGNTKKIVVNGVPIRELKFPSFAICLLKLRKAIIYWDLKHRSSNPQSVAAPQVPRSSSSTSAGGAVFSGSDNSNGNSFSASSPVNCKCFTLHFTLAEFIRQIIYS